MSEQAASEHTGVRRWWLTLVRGLTLRDLTGSERILATALAILYLGTGVSASALAIYFVRYLHTSPTELGAYLSLAAVLGAVAGPVVGHLADRLDTRRLYSTLVWTMAASMCVLAVAPARVALAAVCLIIGCARGSATVMGALVGTTVDPERRVMYRAVARSLQNAMAAIGFGGGAVMLALGSMRAIQIGFFVEAGTLVVAGLLILRSRSRAPSRGPEAAVTGAQRGPRGLPRFAILADPRFLAFTLLSGVFGLQISILSVALPLWISQRLDVPLWTVSVAFVVNIVAVVSMQIPASRGVSGAAVAARRIRIGGLLLAAAALLFPLSTLGRGSVEKVVIMLLLALVLAAGEVQLAVGTWEILYGFAPPGSVGQYQGVLNSGTDLAAILAPSLFAWLTTLSGPVGWTVLALVFAAAAVAVVPLCGAGRSARGQESVPQGSSTVAA